MACLKMKSFREQNPAWWEVRLPKRHSETFTVGFLVKINEEITRQLGPGTAQTLAAVAQIMFS